MAEEKIVMNPGDVDSIVSEYAKQKALASQISVELSGVNNLDVLLLLRVMSIKEPSVEDLAPVCEDMLDGRTIKFKKDGKDIYHPVVYNRGNGNKLAMMFTDAVYLYDILQQTVYALLLKKLTPHLEGSN